LPEPLVLHMVGIQGEQHGGGQVLVVAVDDGHIVGGQLLHGGIADAELRVVEHEIADVLDGGAGFVVTVLL
jgi:hypothetical protein